MKVIYCQNSGSICCLIEDEANVAPAVLDIDVPEGKYLRKIEMRDSKAVPVLEDIQYTQLEVLQQELQALNEKLKTTELALAEMAMQAFTE